MEDHYFQQFRKNYLQVQTEFISAGSLSDPYAVFDNWLSIAQEKVTEEPNAMILSTVSAQGVPTSRAVLLKEYSSENGFVFFTNYQSKKASDIESNPSVTLLFFWPEIGRQIHIMGKASFLSSEKSNAYFATRPRESQIAAWTSCQSRAISSREELEQSYLHMQEKFLDSPVIPRPHFWGGYSVQAQSFEFWEGKANRLHDRVLYDKTESCWQRQRLSP